MPVGFAKPPEANKDEGDKDLPKLSVVKCVK